MTITVLSGTVLVSRGGGWVMVTATPGWTDEDWLNAVTLSGVNPSDSREWEYAILPDGRERWWIGPAPLG